MKALELANTLDSIESMSDWKRDAIRSSSSELRRLVEVNAELLEVLNDALSMSASRWLFHNNGLYQRASEIVTKAKEQ